MDKLTAIFYTTHPDYVGNSCRINLLVELSRHYDMCLLTNQPEFLKSIFGQESQVFKLPNEDKIVQRYLPFASRLFYSIKVSKFINKHSSRKLFIFHDTSDYVLFINKDIQVFNCVHQVHEFIGLTKVTGIRKVISAINHTLLLKGVKRSKICFANSKTIADYLMEKGIKNKILLTPHFVDIEMFKNPSLDNEICNKLYNLKSQGRFIISYTGFVSENRGLYLMLESFALLSDINKDLFFLIVGAEEKYINIINDYISKHNMKNCFSVYGRVNSTYIPGILKCSDVCLSFLENNPVYTISPPQKVIEYFASGKPVIANHIATHELLISDGVNGYLVDTPNEIVEKIKMLSNDTSLYRKMSENAFKTAGLYDKNLILKKYFDCI